MRELPFDVSTYFDANLRDVPNNHAEMAQAVQTLRDQLATPGLKTHEQLRLHGMIGSYARLLGDLDRAHHHLAAAIELSQQQGNVVALLINQLRQAHVYQWQQQYATADAMFAAAVARCEQQPELAAYLDFACQHAAKSLFDQGHYAAALQLFARALALRQAKGDRELIASTELAIAVTRKRISPNPPTDESPPADHSSQSGDPVH